MRIALLLCGVLYSAGCLPPGAPTPGAGNGVDSPPPTTTDPPAPGPTGGNADAGSPAQATPDLAGPVSGSPDLGSTPLTECTTAPSLDRLQNWIASGEGTTVPATGSILVKSGSQYVGKIGFVNAEWHVVPVWTANKFDGQADFSKSASLTLTYSATDDFYVQVRPASHWDGGDKWLTKIPKTSGQVQTKVISFAAQNWTTLPELGTPVYSLADALKEVRGLVFVGKTVNQIEFHGLRVEGYVPPCN
jgi:hypothetical protein